jgi:hypothetical protein
VSCSEQALDVALPLGGTATRAERWLLVEVRVAWGRDAVVGTELGEPVRSRLEAFDGRVLLIRRPGSRAGATVIHALADESGGRATRLELDSVGDLGSVDPATGRPLDAPVVLVCAHGRRDACCARLGVPTYEALCEPLGPGAVWQSSHQGGHRFAANVLVLPWGVQLGRVAPEDAPGVAAALDDGRIPLDHYRGRTLYAPSVQAAEVVVRRELGLDRVGDVRLAGVEGPRVRFDTPSAEVTAVVEEREGSMLPPSCGAAPEAVSTWTARIESDA